MNFVNVESLYPDRFSEARFYVNGRQQVVHFDRFGDSGVYLAASDSTGRRKRRKADQVAGDEKSEDDQSSDGEDDQEDKKKRTLKALEVKAGRRFSRADAERLSRNVRARVLKSPEPQQVVEKGYQHVTREIPWAMEEVMLANYIAKRVPIVAACISTLRNQVMREGLKFMRGNVELVPSADFEEYVTKRLVPFAYQCIDAILTIGVVPILYEMDPETGHRFPYCPQIGTFLIKRHTVHGAMRLRFYWASEQAYASAHSRQTVKVRDGDTTVWRSRQVCDPMMTNGDAQSVGGIYDPTVEIIHNFGYDLLPNGNLGSKVACLIQLAQTRVRLDYAHTTACMNASMPALYTEYNHNMEKQLSQPFKTGYYTSASATVNLSDTPENAASHVYNRDAAQRESFAAMLRFYEAGSGRSAAEMFGVNRDEYCSDLGGTSVVQDAFSNDGSALPWHRQYHASAGRTLKSMPVATPAGDYVAVLEKLDNEICAVMGVPKVLLEGSSIRAGTDLIASRLNDEVSALKKVCSDLLSHIYNNLFLSDDVASYMTSPQRTERFSRERRAAARNKDPSNALVTESDLFVADAIGRVRVSFVKNSSDHIDELQMLYGLEGISREMFVAELARRNNFDPAQLVTDDDKAGGEVPREMKQMAFEPFARYIQMMHGEKMQKQQMKASETQQAAQLQAAEKTQQRALETQAELHREDVKLKLATASGAKRKSTD